MKEPELKERVESVLFSAGKKLPIAEIARLCGKRLLADIESALHELREDYLHKGGLVVLNDGDEWRITVKERYMPYARKITTKVELTKTYMETLAVVAYKSPVLQSAIIKIRTNKAYDHLAQLEQMGYITRTKHGRTKLIRLAPKFFDYFDVPQEALKQKFEPVKEMEMEVAEKEAEKEMINQKIAEKKAEMLAKEQEIKNQQKEEITKVSEEIEGMPKIQLETYNTKVEETEVSDYPEGSQVELEKLGELEIYRTEQRKKKKKAKKKREREAKKETIKKHATKETEAVPEDRMPAKEGSDDGRVISTEEVEKTLKKATPLFSEGISEEIQHKINEKIAELTSPTKNGGAEEMKQKRATEEETADNEEESEEAKSSSEEEESTEEESAEEASEKENTEETTDKNAESENNAEENTPDESEEDSDSEEESAETEEEF